MREIRDIVVHCSATKNGDGRITIKDIDRMHRERGWKRVGYHYVIHVDGTIHIGRSVEEIGAHVQGSNATSIGICMIGTSQFTKAQWSSLGALVRALHMRFPAANIVGHRDFSPDLNGDGIIQPREWLKTCPGFDVRTWWTNRMAYVVGQVFDEIAA